MNKPKYQYMYDDLRIAACGIVTVVGGINELITASSLITFRTGILLIYAVITVWLILARLVKMGAIKYRTKDGHLIRPKKLNGTTQWTFSIIIFLLAIPSGYDFVTNSTAFNDGEEEYVEDMRFKDNGNFNVLIMPLHQECTYEGKQYDIGYVIAKRLESMSIKDSLRISLRYKMAPEEGSFLDKDSAFRLMKYFNADQILYGSYSFSECEGGTSDKVCFMYQVDSKNWGLPHEFTVHNEYKMMSFHGLDDIRYGAGQENIDYIIYWVAGISELRRNKYQRAIQLFQKIKDYESKASVLFQISICYNYLKDYVNSHKALDQVLKLNPQHEEANLHHCMRLLYEGKTGLARKKMEELQEQDPNNVSLVSHLSYVYRKLGDTVRTKIYMDRFLALTPEKDSNYKELGRFFEQLSYYTRAKAYYQKSLSFCDKHADDWNNIGRVSILLGDSLGAKPFFVHALALDANSATALFNLGMLYNREKNFTAAGQHLERAYKTDSFNVRLLIELGKAYQGLKKPGLARKKYQQALLYRPNHEPALKNIRLTQ